MRIRQPIHLLIFLIALVAAGQARAHIGHGSEVEIRVFPDGMRLVFRSSLPFAWTLLGDRAPAMADDAGKAAAIPLLAEAAPGLFRVTSGGEVMEPLKADSMFEVGSHVAFILNFSKPTAWPATVEARFLAQPGSLETGTIRVYDSTVSRFSQDLEPIVDKVLDSATPMVTFSLGAGAAPVMQDPSSSEKPRPLPGKPPETKRVFLAIALFLLGALMVGFLAWRKP